MSKKDEEGRLIHIIGNGKLTSGEHVDYGYERFREFHCFGFKNVDVACSKCRLRFLCFTDRDKIELSHNDFDKSSVLVITAETVAKHCVPDVKYKVVKDKDGEKKVMLDFCKKEKKDDV